MTRWNVVLAGGVGSRFWPLSTPERPKQLLPLITAEPMLRDTLERLKSIAPLERTLVLTNASLASAILEMEPGLPAENIIAEPRPAGTCAALAWAAQLIASRTGPDSVMVCVHADWAIGDEPAFREALDNAATLASRERALVTVGIVPSRAETGFGYIQPGEALPNGAGGAMRVQRFVEKPDRARAETMVRDGYLWNSGIFAWCVGDLLDEMHTHTPEVYPALLAAGDNLEQFFSTVQSVPIDVGVLERSDRVLVIPGEFGWDDVGTWAALHRVRAHDQHGNAIHGAAFVLHAHNNVVHADGPTVVLYGVDDLVVVAHNGLTMVTTHERAADLKTLLDALPPSLRDS